MSEGPLFSLSRLGRNRKTQRTELDILLNLCPCMVLVVDAHNLDILLSNRAVLEISGYEQGELSNLSLQGLFPSWDPGLYLKSGYQSRSSSSMTQGKNLILQHKNLSKIPVQIINWGFSGDEKHIYLVMEGKQRYNTAPDPESLLIGSLEHQSGVIPRGELEELLKVFQSTDLQTALNHILLFAQVMTGASVLAVYSVSSNPAILVSMASHGQSGWLPENLSTQDVVSLKTPQFWQIGARPTSDLHRAAQANHLAYIGTFPFGKAKQVNPATMGILILAGESVVHKDRYLKDCQVITLLIAAVTQKADLVNQYRSILGNLDQAHNLETALQKNIIEGILLLSPELNILDINAAAEKILGFDRMEVRGQPVEYVLIGTETLVEELRKVSERQSILSPLEGRLYRRTGEAVVVKMLAHPIMAQEKLDRILLLIQDLSEQELARDQAYQLEQRAILGEITAVFAHEVRNPINNISTGLELVSLNLAADDPNQSTITRLLQDCDRLAELMKSVLAYSRPAEYAMSRIPLEPFFQNLLERSRPRIERLNIQSSLHVASNCPPIMGNPRALEQVFVNLINNAVQAMGDNGGQLMIKIQPAQEEDIRDFPSSKRDHTRYVEVNVIDTGPGIPQEIQERIFQPFYTTNFTGTGLGLAIAKRIITSHRGNISVTSFPGGTVFRIFLPTSE
jgi:two-component system, NtrC family, sensor histidine kinase AtoS